MRSVARAVAAAAISSSVCGIGSTLVGEATAAIGDGVMNGDGDGNLLALRALFSSGMGDGSESSPLA